jgi:hypothetical protein
MKFRDQVVQRAWDALADLCTERPSLRPELDDLIDQFVELLYSNGMMPSQETEQK